MLCVHIFSLQVNFTLVIVVFMATSWSGWLVQRNNDRIIYLTILKWHLFLFLVIVSIFFLVRLALKKAPSPYQACQYFANPLLGCSGRSQAVLRSSALLAVLYHLRLLLCLWYSNLKIHLLQTYWTKTSERGLGYN